MPGSANATVAPCPRCHLPVTATGAGVVLDAEPHRLGVLGLDGEPLTVREVVAGFRAGQPVGRRRHVCPPAGQGELFAIPGGTDKSTRRRR